MNEHDVIIPQKGDETNFFNRVFGVSEAQMSGWNLANPTPDREDAAEEPVGIRPAIWDAETKVQPEEELSPPARVVSSSVEPLPTTVTMSAVMEEAFPPASAMVVARPQVALATEVSCQFALLERHGGAMWSPRLLVGGLAIAAVVVVFFLK